MSVSSVLKMNQTGLGPEQFHLLLGFFISCPPYPLKSLGSDAAKN